MILKCLCYVLTLKERENIKKSMQYKKHYIKT